MEPKSEFALQEIYYYWVQKKAAETGFLPNPDISKWVWEAFQFGYEKGVEAGAEATENGIRLLMGGTNQ